MPTTISELIPHILRLSRVPLTARVISNLLYLIDLSWVQLYDRPLTPLKYEWQPTGAHCTELDPALDRLQASGMVERCLDADQYLLNGRLPTPIDDVEEKIVGHVVAQFGNRPVESLEGFVVRTPPVARTSAGGTKYGEIDLRLKREERRFSEEQLLSLIDQASKSDRGVAICGEKMLADLRSKGSTTGPESAKS